MREENSSTEESCHHQSEKQAGYDETIQPCLPLSFIDKAVVPVTEQHDHDMGSARDDSVDMAAKVSEVCTNTHVKIYQAEELKNTRAMVHPMSEGTYKEMWMLRYQQYLGNITFLELLDKYEEILGISRFNKP